jgi:hypothetical protein
MGDAQCGFAKHRAQLLPTATTIARLADAIREAQTTPLNAGAIRRDATATEKELAARLADGENGLAVMAAREWRISANAAADVDAVVQRLPLR